MGCNCGGGRRTTTPTAYSVNQSASNREAQLQAQQRAAQAQHAAAQANSGSVIGTPRNLTRPATPYRRT